VERISQPSCEEGQRTGALRFGILASWPWPAPCDLLNTVVGFTTGACAQVSGLLGGASSSAQMIYDPRRLQLKGLIRPIQRTNTYVLTPDSIRVALFCTRLYNRPVGPLAADRPPAPPELRQALPVIYQVDDSAQHARMGTAA
jgi:hypothetical protein